MSQHWKQTLRSVYTESIFYLYCSKLFFKIVGVVRHQTRIAHKQQTLLITKTTQKTADHINIQLHMVYVYCEYIYRHIQIYLYIQVYIYRYIHHPNLIVKARNATKQTRVKRAPRPCCLRISHHSRKWPRCSQQVSRQGGGFGMRANRATNRLETIRQAWHCAPMCQTAMENSAGRALGTSSRAASAWRPIVTGPTIAIAC